MTITVLAVRALVHELMRRGTDVERFCDEVGLDPAKLNDPTARLTFEEQSAAVGHALAITGEPQLGLYVGSRASAAATTVLGGMVASCETLREAADLFLRYAALGVDGGRRRIEVRDGVVSLVSELPDGLVHRAYEHEAIMSLWYLILRSFFGTDRDTPLEVCFTHAPTGPLEVYRRVFDCEVKFLAPENAIRGDASALDRRQLHADPNLTRMLRDRADSLLADMRSPDRLGARIRDFVKLRERPIDVKASTLAEVFGLHERTLRRRLAEQGTTTRDLLEETWREMACAALKEPSKPIKEVAFQLGFANLSGFYRAFRRWTGETPAEYRARVRAS